ncbi:Tetratricopeptide repeat-containing protein [Seinonella peptonophila]|uniref:Tetratricopeptide repeat-containing protein n=1 Tax=Seinonella peptonophila TaxID=112248 RepID=A0A1M4XMU7_9BACL|nr:tetratricopeptide repeat protein [Seinonella peptonophila]SHE94809.1 Tetratricopeptide repeat-containing protein [Seinonella peptonophila]
MKKSPFGQSDQAENVVHLELDAGFFFERAVRSLDKHQYGKALRYFRLSVEKEPDNPINYCNLAGLLSELGYYEESNEILQQVIHEVAPEMHECRFYLANNYANLQEFERSEEFLLEYLQNEPYGEYAEDAEELLYMIAAELGRSPRDPKTATLMPAYMKEHEEARRQLENGQFQKAVELLQPIVEEHPDFIAAQNNLSLAYYYLGDFTRAFATVKKVLDQDSANIHALCNLAIFSDAVEETEMSQMLTKVLKKLIPLHPDLLYKLATSLGILGEDQTAYRLFDRFLRLEMTAETNLYHYLAVAAWNIGRFREAARYWRLGLELVPDSQVFRYYLEQAERWQGRETELGRLSYYFYLPFQEVFMRLSWHKRVKIELNTVLFESMLWAFSQGSQSSRLQVVQILGHLANDKSEAFLRRILVKPHEDDELKRMTLLVLRQMGTKPPYMIWFQGQLLELGLDDQGEATLSTQFEVWSKILESTLDGMTTYTDRQREDVQWLWAGFICQKGGNLPKVRSFGAWSAAFEYMIGRYDHLELSQRKIAEKYGVSPSTVSHHTKELLPIMEQVLK